MLSTMLDSLRQRGSGLMGTLKHGGGGGGGGGNDKKNSHHNTTAPAAFNASNTNTTAANTTTTSSASFTFNYGSNTLGGNSSSHSGTLGRKLFQVHIQNSFTFTNILFMAIAKFKNI